MEPPQRKPLTPEDIARITFIGNPQISPEGDSVAYVAGRADLESNSYRYSIWLADEESFRPLTEGPRDRCPCWSPDGRLIAFVRGEERGAGIYIIPREGGEAWRFYYSKWGVGRISWSPTGSAIAFTVREPLDPEKWRPYAEREKLEVDRIPVWANGEGWVFDRYTHLYVAHYPGGEETLVVGGRVEVVDFDWSPDGSRLAVAVAEDMLRPYSHKVYVVDLVTGERILVAEGFTVAAIRWDPSGSRIALRAHRRERGFTTHFKVYVVPAEGGEPECLTCELDKNAANAVNSDIRGPSCLKLLEWTKAGDILFPVSEKGKVHVYRVRVDGEPQPLLKADMEVIDEFSASKTGEDVAFTRMTPKIPLEVYVYRRERGERVRLTSHNAWVERRLLAEPLSFTADSPHGGSIDFWVLPPARKPDCVRCVPWILYIHGGPKTSYGYSFIHEFHVLSGMGFAVVYSNPRGSDGYSEEFADIRGRYGEVDYDELMKVVDTLETVYPDADPERGGVTGGSYGGYMTNIILTKTRRFKAAVTQRSCSNWVSFYGESDIGWYFAPDLLSTGAPWERPDDYVKASPLFKADKIETPLLIIHALEDYRCPVGEAIQLYTALKALGREVKLILFPGENHDLSRSGRPRQRIARLKAIAGWFKEKLGEPPGGGEETRGSEAG
jgi:acylaminoacyl-peptidase